MTILLAHVLVASQAMLNVVDPSSITRRMCDYTNNVLSISSADALEWNDSNPRNVKDAFPANAPFHLVTGPDVDDRRMAELAVETAKTSMPEVVRENLEDLRVMAPMLQFILRRCRVGVTNETTYLSGTANRAVWRARDFDLNAISRFSKGLSSNSVPMTVTLTPIYEEYKIMPIRRALPEVDYPDPREETIFETPVAIAVALRAPELYRKFRFAASAWPVHDGNVNFKWVPISTNPSGNPSIGPIQGQRSTLSPANGYAEIVLNWNAIRGRRDIAVFARYGKGPYGPPSIISFYVIPNEKRAYDKSGKISMIEYRKHDWIVPQLFQNKPWKDEYVQDSIGNVIGFMRFRAGMMRGETFSNVGEYVVETHPNELPKIAMKVRYFTSADNPDVLDYEVTDKEVRYPLKTFVPCNRGEFPLAKRRK